MANVKITRQDPVPDRGPDPLDGVRAVTVQLTPNETRALLLLAARTGGKPDTTLCGEVETVSTAILAALGATNGWLDKRARRFRRRDDMAQGAVTFLRGGAHV